MLYYHAVMHMKKTIRGSAALIFATVIWGSAFVAQSVGMDYIGPFTFQTVRCFLAVLILLPMIALFDLGRKDGETYLSRWADKRLWRSGLFCGIPLFLACNLQQYALLGTSAGKAGFLTAMYIIMVPVIGRILGKKVSFLIPISVAVATAGLYLLCCAGETSFSMYDVLLLLCALMFSLQITAIDRCPPDLDSLRLNCVQFLLCTVLSAVLMLLCKERPTIAQIQDCALPLGYAGFLSSGIAYSLQIAGQRDLEASAASLLMSLESVFAALFGWLLLDQKMTVPELLGCALVFVAVILAQIPVKTAK